MIRNIQIDATKISNWESFHDYFSEVMGFPKFYGRNMNAWIDCMTCLDEPDAGMTSVHVDLGDILVLCLSGASELKKKCPEIYAALVECSSFVNYRRIEMGEDAILAISFYVN
jgi:hypothetical protein